MPSPKSLNPSSVRLGPPFVYRRRHGSSSRPSPPRLALMGVQADEACSATLAGWLATELVRWQGLDEDLHATMHVLAELAWKPHIATQVLALLAG